MLDAIRNAYAIFEQLNISITGLIVIAIVLALAFLFAVREAATWFFKVDEIKKDVLRLREVTIQLEGEIRSLHNLIGQAQAQVKAQAPLVIPTAPISPATVVMSSPVSEAASKKAANANFPIVH